MRSDKRNPHMLRWLSVVALVALAPQARAAKILYATASSERRVDGYQLDGSGKFVSGSPSVQHGTGGKFPRRVLFNAGLAGAPAPGGERTCVLYVAQTDRIEVLRIGSGGGSLRRLGPPRVSAGINPFDLAVSEDGRMLYVPHSRQKFIAAYPVGEDGDLIDPSMTCLQGRVDGAYQTIAVLGDKLYVGDAAFFGAIDVFQLGPGGNLPRLRRQCGFDGRRAGSEDFTPPTSQRRGLRQAGGFVIDPASKVMVVHERERRQLIAFQLTADGLFDPRLPVPDELVCRPGNQTGTCQCVELGKGERDDCPQQNPDSRTRHTARYMSIALAGSATRKAVFGTQFDKGRIDVTTLNLVTSNGAGPATAPVLAKRVVRQTANDVSASPVRMAVDDRVLYVSGGLNNRIDAYRLGADGLPENDFRPISSTEGSENSFPNDVAVVDTTGCR